MCADKAAAGVGKWRNGKAATSEATRGLFAGQARLSQYSVGRKRVSKAAAIVRMAAVSPRVGRGVRLCHNGGMKTLSKSSERAAMAGVVLLAGLLRFWAIDAKTIWLDEAFSIWIAQHSLWEGWRWLVKIDHHPPSHYLRCSMVGRSHWATRRSRSEACLRCWALRRSRCSMPRADA